MALGQIDIHFRPRTTIKGQALADFVVEFTYQAEGVAEEEQENIELQWWKLYVDGSSNDCGAGAGLMLISPEGHKIMLSGSASKHPTMKPSARFS